MTWLKKRIHGLGLHRKGALVKYSPLSQVQTAIEVSNNGVDDISIVHYIH